MDFDRADPVLTSPQILDAMDALSTSLAETGLCIEWDANRRGDITFTVSRPSEGMRTLLGTIASREPGPLVSRGSFAQYVGDDGHCA
jgi:hypothetical protein